MTILILIGLVVLIIIGLVLWLVTLLLIDHRVCQLIQAQKANTAAIIAAKEKS